MSGPDARITAALVLPALAAALGAFPGPGEGPRVEESDTARHAVSVLENIIEAEESEFAEAEHKESTPGKGNRRIRREYAEGDESRYGELTEEDFELVAGELGVETAAIKAVVSIEAGSQMRGFLAPGVPVVNFDNTMYVRFRKKGSGPDKEAKVPGGISGYGLREWTQLTNARHTDNRAALLGTFWGMFQIGGFNYSRCGCKDVEEFVELMSYSELEQLELFAAFIANAGMLTDLKNKNWASFARKYNGPGYAKRGYHTRMAAAYRKFSAGQ